MSAGHDGVEQELCSMGFDKELVQIALSQCPDGSIEDVVACVLLLSDPSVHQSAVGLAPSESLKMVLVVRQDLMMSPGKVAAQCVHAAFGCSKLADPRIVSDWERGGEAVVCLKCESLEEMRALQVAASAMKLSSYVVQDAGHTEVRCGSQTVLAIGPAAISIVNAVTGHLKLY